MLLPELLFQYTLRRRRAALYRDIYRWDLVRELRAVCGADAAAAFRRFGGGAVVSVHIFSCCAG
jgi:hypothetical protein